MKRFTKKFYTKFSLAHTVQGLFFSESINTLCMKMYSDDDDVDIVVIDKTHYTTAIRLLESNGWRKKNNKSKLRERDKDMFVHKKHNDIVHLHQAFSWNTVPYLDSSILWERKRKYLNVFLPSFEDEILIIAAHSLFENMCIVPEELRYGRELLKKNMDLRFIENRAHLFNWRKGMQTVLVKFKENNSILSLSELLQVRHKKFMSDLQRGKFSLILNEAVAYFLIDWIWCYKNRDKKLYGSS